MKWRVIQSGENCAPYNMAVDEAMMETCILKGGMPTLRLYGWEPPALSLGYFQKKKDFCDLPEYKNLDIVKRLTGGGAIYHHHELTFSIVTPLHNGAVPVNTEESYRSVCKAIIFGLKMLGINAYIRGHKAPANPVSASSKNTPYLCFEKPSSYDIVVNDLKIAGSAQRRKKGTLLHHGSIPLKPRKALGSTSVESAAGKFMKYETVEDAIIKGFAQFFNAVFVKGDLSSEEVFLAEKMAVNKY